MSIPKHLLDLFAASNEEGESGRGRRKAAPAAKRRRTYGARSAADMDEENDSDSDEETSHDRDYENDHADGEASDEDGDAPDVVARGKLEFAIDDERLDEWVKRQKQFNEFETISRTRPDGTQLSDAELNSSVMVIVNVVLAVYLNMQIDSKFVRARLMHRGFTVAPRKFQALTVRYVDPPCKVRAFETGIVDCKGARSVLDGVCGVQRMVDDIRGLVDGHGHMPYENLRCTSLSLQNVVGSVKLQFDVDLHRLSKRHYVTFCRETFNMANIHVATKFPERFAECSAQVLVSENGFVVVTGGKSREQLREVYEAVIDDLSAAGKPPSKAKNSRIMLQRRLRAAAARVRQLLVESANLVAVTPIPPPAPRRRAKAASMGGTSSTHLVRSAGGALVRSAATEVLSRPDVTGLTDAQRMLTLINMRDQQRERAQTVARKLDEEFEAHRALAAGETRTLHPVKQMTTAESLRQAATHFMEDE